MKELIYIYDESNLGPDDTDAREQAQAERRSRIGQAGAAGFTVHVRENGKLDGDPEDKMLPTAALLPSAEGVWADVAADQMSDDTRNLLIAAGAAGKRLMGRIHSNDPIASHIDAFLVNPKPEPTEESKE